MAITLQEFVKTWLGKKLDFDGAYGGQCVDLARRYIQDVLGFPNPKGVTGAADFWTHYDTDPALKNHYEKIPNTPAGLPLPGDILIWSKKINGSFGHIAVALKDINLKTFVSFDQNFPTLSKCTETKHDYKHLLGWFRPKGNHDGDQGPYWPQANDALAAFSGKDNNDPDASVLSRYWGAGDRRSKEIIDKYRRQYPLK